jgi:hypothetical protein
MPARFAPAAVAAAMLAAACASGPGRAAGALVLTDACEMARTPDPGAIVDVPFDIVNGRVYTQVSVNGSGPYTFAVDTGASGLGRADESLTQAIGLPLTGEGETSDGVSVATAQTVRISSLQLGGMTGTNLDVLSRDYSSTAPAGAAISGIISRDFFAEGLLVINFPARRLTFSRDRMLSPSNANVLPYERPFRVPVEIGHTVLEGNLDTGAAVAMVLPPDVFARVSNARVEAAGEGRLTNTIIEMGKATLSGPVRIGEAVVTDVEVRVADRFPEVFVGGQILRNYVVAFDQRSKLAAVCKPES